MADEGRPNAIIIMVDQMKATASHLYGRHGITTPGLERLARLGIRYENATTPHPLCVPARVAMWTAVNPHRTGCTVNRTPMPAGMPHQIAFGFGSVRQPHLMAVYMKDNSVQQAGLCECDLLQAHVAASTKR